MSDSENSGDEIWEEISVHSAGNSDNESSGSDTDEDSDDNEPSDEIEEVRGAEPYRFEPLARRRVQEQLDIASDAGEDDVAVQQPAANDRLNNTDW